MDGYEALRVRAAEKLDLAIQAARKEYRSTVAKIDALRKELGDEVAPKGLKVTRTCLDLVREHHPRDRSFSIADMVQIVKDAAPEVHYTRGAVKSSLYRMADLQELRRIAKDEMGHILWASCDLECEFKPYDVMPMSDVIAEVLEGSEPMRPAEIVVAVQKLGCRSEDDGPFLLRAVRKSLYANPRRFHGEDGRWELSDRPRPGG